MARTRPTVFHIEPTDEIIVPNGGQACASRTRIQYMAQSMPSAHDVRSAVCDLPSNQRKLNILLHVSLLGQRPRRSNSWQRFDKLRTMGQKSPKFSNDDVALATVAMLSQGKTDLPITRRD